MSPTDGEGLTTVNSHLSPNQSSKFKNGLKFLKEKSELFLIFFMFFFYFLFIEIVDLGGQLYFVETGQENLIPIRNVFNSLTLMFLPILITRLNTRFGNFNLVWISSLVMGVISLSIWLFPKMVYPFLFYFIILTRFFNNSLNPHIIKQIKGKGEGKLSHTFAIRDFFLFLGSSTGAFLGFLFSKNDLGFLSLFKFGSLVILLLFGLITILTFRNRGKNPNSNSKSLNSQGQKSPQKIKFRQIKQKQSFLIIITITSLVGFIGTTFAFLPLILTKIGIVDQNIFSSFALGYLFVSLLSIIITKITPKGKSHLFFLIDLIIDIIPLGMIILFPTRLGWVSFAVLLYISRDFIRPLSMDYIYSFFDETEIEFVWGMLGSIPATFSISFALLIPYLIEQISWKLPLIISLAIAIIVFLIAFFFLGENIKSGRSEEKSD